MQKTANQKIPILSGLYQAAEAGNLERVQLLVERGTDKEKTGKNGGRTPLFGASKKNINVVQYLVEQGFDIEKGNRLLS